MCTSFGFPCTGFRCFVNLTEGVFIARSKENKVRLHPSSTLIDKKSTSKRNSADLTKTSVARVPTDWFIFDEMTRFGRLALVRTVTAVSPFTVMIFAGPNRLPIGAVSETDSGMQGSVPKNFYDISFSRSESSDRRSHSTM